MFVYINEYGDNQVVDVKLDKFDTWNADWSLAQVIYPVLIQLRETNQGSCQMDDEDCDPLIRHLDVHEKWDWALGEMAWAFAQSFDDYGSNDMIRETEILHGKMFADGDVDTWLLDSAKKMYADYEWERDVYQKRITRGRMLFAKYYSGLWD